MSRSGVVSMWLLVLLALAIAASGRVLGDYRRQSQYQHMSTERILLEEQARSLVALEGVHEFEWDGFRWYRHVEGDVVRVGTEQNGMCHELVFRDGELIERRRRDVSP